MEIEIRKKNFNPTEKKA